MERWIKAMLLLLVGALFAGCTASSSVAAPNKVTVQFNWSHNVEFVGFYVAQQLGYYEDANLDVTLVPGGPSTDVAAEIVAGNAHFGVGAAEQVIYSRYLGHDLVAVASIFQLNPLGIMALDDNGISQPQDLVGKTVGVISKKMDTSWDIQFLALLERMNINQSEITFSVIEDYYGANSLLYNDMQAVTGFFSTNELVQATLDNQDVVWLFYSDYGGGGYVNPIFTTEYLIEQDSDMVERFVKATMQGYQYALVNPEKAAEISLQYYDKLVSIDLQTVIAMMHAQVPFIDTGDVQIGWMDQLVWEYTLNMLIDQGAILATTDIGVPYTNEFLPQE